MKQFNKRKLSVVISLLLCMILAFGSTFAYLTDTTSKTNTVTIGKVEIDVVEELWSQLPDTNGDGIPDAAEHVIPSQTVTKDPSIKNTGNNDAYVYLSVEVPNRNITSFNPDGTKVNGGNPTETDLFNYEINDGWMLISSKTESGKTVYTYGYEEKLAAGAETPTLFDSVTVVNTQESQGLEETIQNIVINGYAIQYDNVEDLLNGWNIINNQAGLGTPSISNILIPGPEFNATIPATATKVAFVDDVAPAAYTFENGKLLDVSDAQDTGVVSWYDEATTTYYVSTQRNELDALINPDSSYMFSQKPSLTDFDFTYLDTKISTDMSYMFYRSTGLTSIDVSSFVTDNVTDMGYMFGSNNKSYGMKLTNINLGENFETSKVTSFLGMFRFCMSLEEVDISMFDTSSAKSLSRMFDRCNSLKTVDVSGFNTSSVENLSTMFQRCWALEELDVSGWNTSNCTDFSFLFSECNKVKELDVSQWNVSKALNMQQVFNNCYVITNLEVSEWNPKLCENVSYLCYGCKELKIFDASKWDLGNVKIANSMFANCEKLQYFSTKKWNTSSMEKIGFMFYGCKSFKKLDCEDWDVRNVKSFDHFMAHSQMEEYDVSKWQVTNKCENLNAIFHSTKETNIDVTDWDTSNVIAFNQMFDGMYYLEEVDGLETWNTSNGVCFAEMFHSCGSLKEINLSSFDTRKANTGTIISDNKDKSYGLQDMFTGCNGLQKLTLSESFTRFGDGNISSSLYAYFPTSSSGYWYNAETGQAYLPEEIPDLTAATYVATMP